MAMMLKHTNRVQKVRSPKTQSLKQEVVRLRSLVIGIAGTDEERSYRPEFVERTLRAANEIPRYTFTNPADFLKHLRSL